MRAIVALIIAAAPLAATAPALAAPQAAARATQASGVVTDASTGRPLGGVFVQQEGALTSAFTDADGAFTLSLDPGQPMRLQFTANGYTARTTEVGKGKGLAIKLSPISSLVPESAPLHPPANPATAEDAPISPLDSRVAFDYRVRYENEADAANANTLAGWANNDYRLALRYRWTRLLVDAELMHHQTPVDVATLDRTLNPAFDPSTWEAGARVGYIQPLPGGWESGWGVAYRFKDVTPNNHDVPYIGNGADFEQTRHAFGLSGTLGWTSPRTPWGFEASVQGYPLIYAIAKAPGTPFANQWAVEANAELTYEIAHGLRLGAGYRFEDWQGNGSDVSHVVLATFHYTPVGIFKGSER